ncbi:hypothetical protein Bbelb_286140 [Branchiostoma belcheri]|nr:hypothetical protein Bbelb_286140 [Branchiostoma belcheri]
MDKEKEKALHEAAERGDTVRVKQLLQEGKRTPLHRAAEKGHHETVSTLLAAGADVNLRDRELMTPLHLAARNSHHETVSALLAAGADVNTRDRQERTPLCWAARNGRHETVSALLAAGADVNIRDREKSTPLHKAAANSDHETVSVLLTAGADVNIQDWLQRTPLHEAARNGHHETVSALLAAGADVNTRDRQESALHKAARNGHHETVSALLAAGADVNIQDGERRSPLHWAAEDGHHETVSVLLAAGADVNTHDSGLMTPLHLAAEKGHHETVSALLAAGADVNIRDWEGRTPLCWAAENGHHETVSALLAAGADVNIRDREERTPLHLAAVNGHHETVSVLLAAGANANTLDGKQRTPLHLAAENGHHETVSALLAAGADVNIRGWQLMTPLHLATRNGHHETVSALLAAGADVNIRGWELMTPLHLAARNGYHETVSVLLAAGADVNTQDWGVSALHKAAGNGHHETVSALLAAGADVNIQDSGQRTPLHLAARNGHHETVSALLAAGADVNMRDGEQRTPLHRAAENGHHKTVSALLAAGADMNTKDWHWQGIQRTPLHLAAENGHHETVSALLAAGADVNVRERQGMTPLHLAAENGHHKTVSVLLAASADVNTDLQGSANVYLPRPSSTSLRLAAENRHIETVSVLLKAGADVNTLSTTEKDSLLHQASRSGYHETVSALLAAGADRNAPGVLYAAGLSGRRETSMTPLHLAALNGHHETVSALLAAGADVNAKDRQVPRQTSPRITVPKIILPTRSKYKSQSAVSSSSVIHPLPTMASAKRKEPQSRRRDEEAGPSGIRKDSRTTDFERMLNSILSRLDRTDVRLLMRVWSAHTGKPESLGAVQPVDWIKDMMKNEYIPTGDLRMLEKDMTAAGISFPSVVRDIPDVPEELKYTKTTEAAVGPTGGELEIPGFVKLVVPPGVLQQDTMITMSTVDVAAILRDSESFNWISGYPWSLGEDVCPRKLLDQVLFSPAVDVNLHGAELNGDLEVQTWRPPGSEGMECLLLKHHDGEGWTDITTSTSCRIYSDKISISLRSFSSVANIWAPVKAALISVRKMIVSALSSRTLDCRFAAYIKPMANDVQFHIVCKDQSIQTDEYLPGFTKCGGNAAMFDLFHGDVLEVAVSVRGGQAKSMQMELRSMQCRDKYGQNIQMFLDRPNGDCVKGEVDVRKVQVPSFRTVCQLIFQEEDNITPSDDGKGKGHSRKRRKVNPPLPKEKIKESEEVRDEAAGPSGARADTGAVDVEESFEKIIDATSHKWDDLARKLGFSENQIDGIYNSKKDQDHRCREVLRRWRDREGSEATLQVLKQALIDIGKRLTAEGLTPSTKPSTTCSHTSRCGVLLGLLTD